MKLNHQPRFIMNTQLTFAFPAPTATRVRRHTPEHRAAMRALKAKIAISLAIGGSLIMLAALWPMVAMRAF
ncbi:MAG: hypothetical protein E1N59_810 [Puniceicoccaceae bacterium 5H]|nr:MAG: hypothetical protein E1N59_810 [Puniceicoccaceae bacterium 5H]